MQITDIPSEYIKPHYSTKIIKSIYNYFLKYYSEEMITKIFTDLKMSKEYFLNDDNWHSNELNKKLCEKIIHESQDQKILFNIGKDLLQPQNINFLEHQILKLLPPYILFKNLPTQASKINNIFKIQTLLSRPGHFKYQIIVNKELDVHPGVFENTEGSLYAFKEFCQLENFSVASTKRDLDINTIYEYDIRYTALKYWLSKIIPFTVFTFLTFIIIQKILLNEIQNIKLFTTLSFSFNMLLAYFTFTLASKIYKMIKSNSIYYVNTKEKNQKIYEKTVQLENKLNEEKYVKNICLTLINSKKPEDIIDDSLDSICKNNKYEKAMVMVSSEKNSTLSTASIRGIKASSRLKNLILSYPAADQESLLFANILDNKKAILIDQIEEFKKKIKKENQELIENISVNSLIVSPIRDQERSYGLLIIGSTDESNKLNTNDLKFIEHISSLMALFFQKSYTLETESTLRSVFEKYVPKNVLLEMNNLKDKNNWRIPPQQKHVASMFIDLKGFTDVSEAMPPDKVFKMLDTYFEEIAQIVGSKGGIIDNIIADEMVIFFPQTEGNKHCSDALLTSIEIASEWGRIQKKLGNLNLPILSIGIGIHSGNASIGTVGSDIRSNYTCLGDTINSTSRIQKLTRKYFNNEDSVSILASEQLFMEASVPIRHTVVKNEKIRGKKQEINLVVIDQKEAIAFNSFLKNMKVA